MRAWHHPHRATREAGFGRDSNWWCGWRAVLTQDQAIARGKDPTDITDKVRRAASQNRLGGDAACRREIAIYPRKRPADRKPLPGQKEVCLVPANLFAVDLGAHRGACEGDPHGLCDGKVAPHARHFDGCGELPQVQERRRFCKGCAIGRAARGKALRCQGCAAQILDRHLRTGAKDLKSRGHRVISSLAPPRPSVLSGASAARSV